MEQIWQETGRRLREIRRDHHLSQAEFGKRLGLTGERVKDRIFRYEKGRSPIPSRILLLISERFDVSTDWLLFRRGKKYLSEKPREKGLADSAEQLIENVIKQTEKALRDGLEAAISGYPFEAPSVPARAPAILQVIYSEEERRKVVVPFSKLASSRIADFTPILKKAPAGRFQLEQSRLSGHSVEALYFPHMPEKRKIALRVEGKSMEPIYHGEDFIIVSEEETPQRKEAVVVFSDRSCTFKIVERSESEITLRPLNPHYPVQRVSPESVMRIYPVVGHIRFAKGEEA